MRIKDELESLKSSAQFKVWKKKNDSAKAYLAHIFYMSNNPIEIGFYHPDSNTVTSFTMDNFKETPHQEVFSKEPTIPELKIDEVKVDLEDALEVAREYQKKECPADKPQKEIVILQCLNNTQLYNITFITITFKTINIRVDAKNKKILHAQVSSVMEFKSQ